MTASVETQGMTRRGMLGWLTTVGAFGLSACGDFADNFVTGPRLAYRFRITVIVDTPQGEKTGSSVMEGFAQKTPELMGGRPSITGLIGEAVAVDIAPGKTLFMLLTGGYRTLEELVTNALSGQSDGPAQLAMYEALGQLGSVGRTAVMPASVNTQPGSIKPDIVSLYPMFVTFADITDPKTVTRVDPADLAATFGTGVTLKRVVVQITKDAVTTGIEKRLPLVFWQTWSANHQTEMKTNGGAMSNPYFKSLSGQLSRDDFTTETAK